MPTKGAVTCAWSLLDRWLHLQPDSGNLARARRVRPGLELGQRKASATALYAALNAQEDEIRLDSGWG